jgi:predicted short-subunit dehydrogenase-like oxidoreductase (DUF2520 family)
MKKLLFLLLFANSILAQVGIGTTTPNASSSLDISSTNSGLLIPRVNLINVTNGITPINAPATSLLVYNTNVAVTGGNGAGYYYWNGTQWTNLTTGNSNDWSLIGNAGTNPSANFIGTTDDNDLVFKRDNIVSGKLTLSNTSFGLNTLALNTTGYNNTAVGSNSLRSNTTGFFNTADGFNSLYSNTSGYYNTAIGYNSLYSNTIGESNVAIGNEALYSNTTGIFNSALGLQALYSNISGNNNTATGTKSLYSNTTGFFNSGNGFESLYSNTSGNYNTANGATSLISNTSGRDNTANGYASLRSNTTGIENVANGTNSLYYNTTGNQNTSSGALSLFKNTIGNNNTVYGSYSMYENTTGNSNTANGDRALVNNLSGNFNSAFGGFSIQNNTSGNSNTGIGYNTLFNVVSGSNNIGIGYLADVPDPNGNYQMSIANVIYGKDLNTTLNGKIGIGTNNPTSTLDVNGQVTIDQKNFGGYGGLLIKGDQPGNNYPNITFSTLNDIGIDEIAAYIGGNINDNTTGSEAMDLSFLTSTNGQSSLSEKMRIKDNGNVGIGTTTPTQKLDIAGKIKITDGTEGIGKVLVSNATGVGSWVTTNSIKSAVTGVFPGAGANIGAGTSVGVSSPASYCNAYIDLPPGRWMVFGTYLLNNSNTPLTSEQSVWVRCIFSLSNVAALPTTDIISGGLISGTLSGPNEFGIANGQTIIQNPNPEGGATKRYYMWAAVQKYGTTPTTFYVNGLGSSFWGENQLTAILKPFLYFYQMIQIVIIGSGNVAQHLISAFAKCDTVEVIQAFAREKKSLSLLLDSSKITSNYSDIKEADLYLIAVSDNAISEVSSQIPFKNKLICHTSGSISIDDLDDKNRKAVFYPLQTFSKNKEINFKEIPICLEAQNFEDYKLLKKVGESVSDSIFEINSEQRKSVHIAAVFVSNFVNHLYSIGNEICRENNISFDILKPLIIETSNKILKLSPTEAQTGPAKRNDTTIINAHLNFLSDENQKEIYKLLSKSIIDYGKKL